jgi:hypothetical protein
MSEKFLDVDLVNLYGRTQLFGAVVVSDEFGIIKIYDDNRNEMILTFLEADKLAYFIITRGRSIKKE